MFLGAAFLLWGGAIDSSVTCVPRRAFPGERNTGLSQLRDVILTNLGMQLQKNRFGSDDDDHYRCEEARPHLLALLPFSQYSLLSSLLVT